MQSSLVLNMFFKTRWLQRYNKELARFDVTGDKFSPSCESETNSI